MWMGGSHLPCGFREAVEHEGMIDDFIIGVIGGTLGEKLFGKWSRRHPYITVAICGPILAAVAYLTISQLLKK